VNQLLVKKKIACFLQEDLRDGDLTSEGIFDQDADGCGQFIAKEDGVICGLGIPQITYDLFAADSVQFKAFVSEGEFINSGTVIGEAKGKIQILLQAERVILNLMQRMSGIATQTRRAVEILQNSRLKVCDTRKTMPGLRIFDKYAVQIGGGANHRFSLNDSVMIKDNHIAFSGGIPQAVAKVRKKLGPTVKIEIEVKSESELKEAILAKADIIMFDNQNLETINRWSKLVPEGIIIEISGGISLDNLVQYQNAQADYVSMGALTHSTKAMDLSFLDQTNY
jgi:nicotinate-nucleotide pyrophosphorylase (carboxylating)